MLALAWAELDLLSIEISRLQSQRQAAKKLGNAARMTTLTASLNEAMAAREKLVSRLTALIATGGLAGEPAPHQRVE